MSMKCSMVEDLLPLYVEGMCSENTTKEVEAHLQKCDKCREKMELSKTGLSSILETAQSGSNNQGNPASKKDVRDKLAVDGMKKVKKRLSSRKIAAFILGLLLVVVLGTAGLLYYGECTGESINFTTINNMMTIRKISAALCEYDVEPLLERTSLGMAAAYLSDEDYLGGEPWDQIKEYQRAKLEEALWYHFKGEEIHYKIVDVEYMFNNDFATGVSAYSTGNYMNPSACIIVRFYNENTSVDLSFFQRADRKFYYEDDINGLFDDIPTFDCLEADDDIIRVVSAAVSKASRDEKSPAGALSLLFRYDNSYYEKMGLDADDEVVRDRMDAIYERGYSVTQILYQGQRYDHEKKTKVYQCQFKVENKDGACMYMKQDFYYGEYDLYVIKDQPAKLIYATEDMPEEIIRQSLELLAP